MKWILNNTQQFISISNKINLFKNNLVNNKNNNIYKSFNNSLIDFKNSIISHSKINSIEDLFQLAPYASNKKINEIIKLNQFKNWSKI